MAVLLALAVWCLVLSTALDRRFTAWALRRAERGAGAVARRVLLWHLRWFGVWLVVWVLSIALVKEDPDHREAAFAVVPMILLWGPRAFWFAAAIPRDFVEAGADPAIADAVVRAGRPPALVGGFIAVAALAVTFSS